MGSAEPHERSRPGRFRGSVTSCLRSEYERIPSPTGAAWGIQRRTGEADLFLEFRLGNVGSRLDVGDALTVSGWGKSSQDAVASPVFSECQPRDVSLDSQKTRVGAGILTIYGVSIRKSALPIGDAIFGSFGEATAVSPIALTRVRQTGIHRRPEQESAHAVAVPGHAKALGDSNRPRELLPWAPGCEKKVLELRNRNVKGSIQLARIAGVNIPTSKRVPIALTYIHGIGHATSRRICEAVGVDQARRVNDLSDADVLRIREFIDANLSVEGDLRREVQMNIKHLMDLGCYRGLRHRRNLPVRGQRTHTNARTRKGPAKPIAGKKK